MGSDVCQRPMQEDATEHIASVIERIKPEYLVRASVRALFVYCMKRGFTKM